jgi:hypothetical protein
MTAFEGQAAFLSNIFCFLNGLSNKMAPLSRKKIKDGLSNMGFPWLRLVFPFLLNAQPAKSRQYSVSGIVTDRHPRKAYYMKPLLL